MSSTAAVDRNPNKAIFDTRIEAIENAEEKIDVLSRHSDTQGSRKKPVSPTRDQIDEIELKNLRAKKEAKQRLQEWQLEIEQENEELELYGGQAELRLKQKDEELRL